MRNRLNRRNSLVVTLSDIVIIGLVEVFAVMALALLIVFVMNHRLHVKAKALNVQLHQLKETTRFLLTKLNTVMAEAREAKAHKQPEPVPDLESLEPEVSSIDEADLKQKWGYLCDASISLVTKGTPESAEDLIEIIKVINADLGLSDVIMPSMEPKTAYVDYGLDGLKQQATDNIALISKLLSDKDAAETQVSVKESELEQLHRYLKESESCIGMLEEELSIANQKLAELPAESADGNSEEVTEMKNLIQRFSQESRDMLMCIETLEQENAEFRAQAGQA